MRQAKQHENGKTLAAIDLGSNSFHLIIVRVDTDNHVQIVDRIKEMVRLGDGLGPRRHLRKSAQQRALACLARFAQRIRNIDRHNIKVVGTNTLRMATNAAEFIRKAELVLGARIEIISGMEEARLVYLGVSHSLAGQGKRRLVVDIGGGSTEVIIGEKFTPLRMESLAMGCVSFTRKYFPDGVITGDLIGKAELAAGLKTEGISRQFLDTGWQSTVGSSGTVKSIARIAAENGICSDGINRNTLTFIRERLLEAGDIGHIDIKGLSEDRRQVLPGGFVVLQAIFNAFDIDHMAVSDGAVREGLIYEMIGRIRHEDVREKTIDNMQRRYAVDISHARSVEHTCRLIHEMVAYDWGIDDSEDLNLLVWAARVHEIGLAVSHNRYTQHGAYILQHSDMYGFTLTEQSILSVLVRLHRGKFSGKHFRDFPQGRRKIIKRLCVVLRLAIILQRSRNYSEFNELTFKAKKKRLTMICPHSWLAQRPLTRKDLLDEKKRLREAIDYSLKVMTDRSTPQ